MPLCCSYRSRRSEASAECPWSSAVVAAKDPRVSKIRIVYAQISQLTRRAPTRAHESGRRCSRVPRERDLRDRLLRSWAEHKPPRRDGRMTYARYPEDAASPTSASGISFAALFAWPSSSAAAPRACLARRSINAHPPFSGISYRTRSDAPSGSDAPMGLAMLASYSRGWFAAGDIVGLSQLAPPPELRPRAYSSLHSRDFAVHISPSFSE
jgi:hypothetical protein